MGEARRRRLVSVPVAPAVQTIPRQVRLGPKLHARYDEVYALVVADCASRQERPPGLEEFDTAVVKIGLEVIVTKTERHAQQSRLVLSPEELRAAAQRKLTVDVARS